MSLAVSNHKLVFGIVAFVFILTVYQTALYTTKFNLLQTSQHNFLPPRPLALYQNLQKISRSDNITFFDIVKDVPKRRVTNETRIWVSMGLCFSSNTDLYGKKKYPYVAVTPFALLLWNYFVPDVRLILFLVYDSKYEVRERMKRYQESLGQIEHLEIRWVLDDGMDCVMKSQTIRMWAFADPVVQDNDIVMTLDVNAFIVTKNILNPIYEHPEMSIWVYQYHNSAHITGSIGESFNENFLAAYADVWRKIVDPGPNMTIPTAEWADRRIGEVGLQEVGRDDRWYYDQWITTYGILKNRICTVPEYSGLWNLPGLHERGLYFPGMNDGGTCWHGKHHQDCNIYIHIVPYGCKWWHFVPFQGLDDHIDKFNEITKNYYSLNMTNMFSK